MFSVIPDICYPAGIYLMRKTKVSAHHDVINDYNHMHRNNNDRSAAVELGQSRYYQELTFPDLFNKDSQLEMNNETN
jgi:hypothetical protein